MRTQDTIRQSRARHTRETSPAFAGAFHDIWAPDLSRAPALHLLSSGLDRDTEDMLRDWHAAQSRRRRE
jgi:hypothetical protein